MRPAQLRRFAVHGARRAVHDRVGFNEAGAAAPVCPLRRKIMELEFAIGFNEAGAAAPVCLTKFLFVHLTNFRFNEAGAAAPVCRRPERSGTERHRELQ